MKQDQVTADTSRGDDTNPWTAWMGASHGMPFPGGPAQDAWSYWRDACQRAVLFWDVMRQRGDNYFANTAKTAPNVLKFEFTLVADGRKLPRPVNYALVRITPPREHLPARAHTSTNTSHPFVLPAAFTSPCSGQTPARSSFAEAITSSGAAFRHVTRSGTPRAWA